jgi:hypothetical protein
MRQHLVKTPGRRWLPAEMTRPPLLDDAIPAGPVQARYALLINPFYPKDPNASFGKHVLTPTLALTSFAATSTGRSGRTKTCSTGGRLSHLCRKWWDQST